VLEVTDLTRTYGHGPTAYTAVKDVSFTVAQGELVSIVGPSGCGKSTLLRCISGLTAPTSGRVTLRDVPVTGVPDGLAVVLQEYGRSLFPWLTVRDNVAMPLKRTTRGRAARRSAADAALASVGLPGSGDKYPWQLSGGMQQRTAIARALAADPALLLMDEPFGSVDAQTREDLEDLVLQVRRERDITILVVTHDIDESVYLADRVIVLTAGPGQVRADLNVTLPSPRDQIETKGHPDFVHLRTEVSRLVRSRDDLAAQSDAESGAAEPEEVAAQPDTTAPDDVTAQPDTESGAAEPEEVTAQPDTTASDDDTAQPDTTAPDDDTAESDTTASDDVVVRSGAAASDS